MLLREPLTGIKMMQGHFVMHLALFTVSYLYVDTGLYKEKDTDFVLNDARQGELDIFYYLKWGHLLTALL